MAFRALRRKVAEIDEQHRASMETIGDDLGELHFGADQAASRRRFLTRAATGGAIAFGAVVVPVGSMIPAALAQTEGTTPGSAPDAPAAPAGDGTPPLVDGNDLVIVQFAQTIELAIVAAYGTLVGTGKLAPAVAQTAREFSLHHIEHASALAELAGGEALNEANPRLVAQLTPLIEQATDQNELVTIAYNLEEGAAATYAFALGELDNWQAAGSASKILPIESQHAVAWSQVLYRDPAEWAVQITRWIPNFQSATGAFDVAEYAAS